jgi:dephospho-CoA kinase
MADHVIDNSGTPEQTRTQVEDLVRRLTQGRLGGGPAPARA